MTPLAASAKPAPVIAEAADSLTQFLRQVAPPLRKEKSKDLLAGRYRLHADQPLPAFNTTLARAFAATDTEQANKTVYALLCASGYPPRSDTAAWLASVSHPHLTNVLAAGPVELSGVQDNHFVAVIEQPRGKTLAALLTEKPTPWSDRLMIDHIITPLAATLKLFEAKGLRHGRVNLENIYFSDTAVLGSTIGEPAGYSQHFLYEPVSLLSCPPAGKGEGADASDMYALGIVVLQLWLGRVFGVPEKAGFERNLRERGAYTVFIGDVRVPESLADFFRGTLCDNSQERWRADTVIAWAQGKKIPAPPITHAQDATRPFSFNNMMFSGRRALSGALFSHWELACSEIHDSHIARWVDIGLRQPEQAETLQRIMRQAGDNPRMANEALARSLLVLEPDGPLRLRSMAIKIDGMGDMLCAAWFTQQGEQLQAISDIIEFDLAHIWLSQQKHEVPARSAATVAKLQKLRGVVRSQALGAGMERALYELNPTLPCASALVKADHITTLGGLLEALDAAARTQPVDTLLYDRHILAFAASRMELGEIKVPMLSALPAFMQVTEAAVIKIFALAQEKTNTTALPGLASWLALRLMPHAAQLRSHELQGHLASRLCKAAAAGNLPQMLELITSQELASLDEDGYVRAAANWRTQEHRIQLMRHPGWVADRAREISETLMPLFAYLVFAVMVYISFMRDL